MRFILQNHQEAACLRDTLRLFFSRLEPSEEGFKGQLYQVSPPYQGLDLVICSALNRPLSLNVLRGREEAPPATVTTYLIPQDAFVQGTTVKPELPEDTLVEPRPPWGTRGELELSQGVMVESGCKLPEPAAGQPGSIWQLSQEVPSADVRRELKRQAYFALSELTGIAWPWGSLTGVRPSQVAAQVLADLEAGGFEAGGKYGEILAEGQPGWLLAGGASSPTGFQPLCGPDFNAAAAHILQDHFAVAALKAQKLVQVTLAEQDILATLPSEDYLVYLGVPFCPGRCAYCSFIAQDASRFADQLGDYARALAREIQLVGQELAGRGQVAALYMGGGTPTSLSASDLDLVLSSARRYLPLRPDAELTVEAGRADTLDRDKLQVMRDQGIGRLCINPQTMHDRTLRRIGRRHTVAQVYEALDLARQAGFNDINMDLILGLPGEDPLDFDDSLKQIMRLAPASLTIHSLAFKRSAYLFDQFQNLVPGNLAPGTLTPENLTPGNLAPGTLSPENLTPGRKDGPPQESQAGPDLQAQLLLPNPAWLEALTQAEEQLQAAGYEAYYLYRQKQVISGLENTGYAQAGQACTYNVGMMSDQRQVIGLGAGAASKCIRDGHLDRLYNTKDLGEYMADIETIAHKKVQFFLN